MSAMRTVYHYQKNLIETPRILSYLTSRGLSEETIKYFHLGLSTSYVEEKRVDGIEMHKGKHPYFTHRIMIPIAKNIFTGRDVLDLDEKYLSSDAIATRDRDATKDYINPKYKHSTRYLKGEMLFNHKSLKGKDVAVIMESQFNVMSLHQGLKEGGLDKKYGGVGIGGSDITQEHLDIIKSYGIGNIVLMLDGDRAGVRGMAKSVTLIIKNGFDFKIVVIDDGQDVNDILVSSKNNTDFLKNTILKKKKNPLIFYAQYMMSFKRVRERDELLKEMIDVINPSIMSRTIFKEVQNYLSEKKYYDSQAIRYVRLFFQIP